MDSRITWSVPPTPHFSRFATWEGRLVFASVSPSGAPLLGAWLLMLYPNGRTSNARCIYVASEAQGKRFVERWARAHAAAIGRQAPPPKPTF
jgi:hypothetical protein